MAVAAARAQDVERLALVDQDWLPVSIRQLQDAELHPLPVLRRLPRRLLFLLRNRPGCWCTHWMERRRYLRRPHRHLQQEHLPRQPVDATEPVVEGVQLLRPRPRLRRSDRKGAEIFS